MILGELHSSVQFYHLRVCPCSSSTWAHSTFGAVLASGGRLAVRNCCSLGPCRTEGGLAVTILSFARHCHSAEFLKLWFPGAWQRLPGPVEEHEKSNRGLEGRVGSRVLEWCPSVAHHGACDPA